MKVKVQFEAQLREAAGCDSTDVTLDSGAFNELFQTLSSGSTEALSNRLLNQDGQPQSSLLIFLNDQSVASHQLGECVIRDGDVISLYPPIAGG